jgi:hypothetical protein
MTFTEGALVSLFQAYSATPFQSKKKGRQRLRKWLVPNILHLKAELYLHTPIPFPFNTAQVTEHLTIKAISTYDLEEVVQGVAIEFEVQFLRDHQLHPVNITCRKLAAVVLHHGRQNGVHRLKKERFK